jgi:hypothetical protein
MAGSSELHKFAQPGDATAREGRGLSFFRLLSPAGAGGQRPVSDSLGALISHITDLATANRTEVGTIVDAVPGARCYRVQPESGGSTIDCCRATHAAVAPLGVYDADTLTVGTNVFFVRHKQKTSGTIVGCEPAYMYDSRLYYGDCVSMGSNTGLQIESGHQEPFNLGGSIGSLNLNGGITAWSGRSPIDSLEIGEFHKATETGLAIHLDPYMTYMRSNEWSGLWMFYWDGLVRLAGENFQRWAGPTEVESYDDEGETCWYHGIAPYPWEHMGQIGGPSDPTAAVAASAVQGAQAHYAGYEPNYDDLQPFHRFREYAGYIGQGQKKMMCAPDLDGGTGDFLYSDCYYQTVGLHEQNVSMSGHYSVRSALGITIAKRPIIPVPKRCEIVTSALGDDHTTYKAADKFGAGPAHKVNPTPLPAAVSADEQHLHSAACIMDLHAHLFNWESPHPFHYHEFDYFYPEESEYEPVATNQEVPEWSDLDSDYQWYLDIPSTDTVTVDHRTGETATVYQNTSYITLLDEGGICIGDGWGAEIRLAGGCIWLQAPGDVFLEPGRNLITWAGRDICLRSCYSVDITANTKDIKIKAEENLHMLAANSGGPYGVFIECRSEGDTYGNPSYDFANFCGEDIDCTGIVMKAKETEIIGWGKTIYLRTNDESDLTGKHAGYDGVPPTPPKPGDIVLDTKGNSDIVTRSNYVKHFVNCAVAHIFPDEAGDAVNFFTAVGATLCGDVYTDGDVLSYGSHLCRHNFMSAQGHFYSRNGGNVARLAASAASAVGGAIATGHNYEETLKTWSTNRFSIDLEEMWYDPGRPGNANVIRSAWMSLRVPVDYKNDEFVHYEPRWQQMARLHTDTVPQWEENAVESNHAGDPDWDDTYPFPGKKRLITEASFQRQGLKLYDTGTPAAEAGWAEDRGALYEADCTLNAPVTANLNQNYKHVGRNETWT